MSTAHAATVAQTLSLAAIVECATIVDALARNGEAPQEAVEMLLASLFRFEWNEVADVYGGTAMLVGSLQRLESMLERGSTEPRSPVLRYMLALMHLGKRLMRDPGRIAVIRSRLHEVATSDDGSMTPLDRLAPALAAIYQDTISRYSYRIRVAGSGVHLRDPEVVARIRALLLAGVRAAVLWRFVGGSLPRVLLMRSQLIKACRALRAVS